MSLPSHGYGLRVSWLVALALLFAASVPVVAADRDAAVTPAGAFASLEFAAPALVPAAATAPEAEPAPLVSRSFVAILGMPRPTSRSVVLTPRPEERPLTTKRPSLLPVLYASFAGLQVADFFSTRQGLASGAHEANPLMRHVVSSNAGFMAMKAGAAAGSIFVAERMWKKNPAAAIATMVAMNSLYGIVVAHNYSVVRGLQP